MLKLARKTMTAALAAAGLACAGAAVADDATPTKTERRSVQGVIRIERPDGTVEEHRFGGADAERTLQDAIKELQKSAKTRTADPTIRKAPPGELSPPTGSPDRVMYLQTLASDGKIAKFGIGVSISPAVPEAVRAHLKLPEGEGLLIQGIADDSPAAKAGLKEHDILLKVGDTPLKKHVDLIQAVDAAGEKDAALSLSVLSAGERKTVELTPVKADTIGWKPTKTALFRTFELPVGAPPGVEAEGDVLFHRFQPALKLPNGALGAPRVHFERFPAMSPDLDQRLQNLERQIEKLTDQLERFEKSQAKEKCSN